MSIESEIARKAEKAQSGRTTHTFEVPREKGYPPDIETVTLVEISADEEIMASKRAKGDTFRLAYELAKQSVWAVNGNRVSLGDNSLDRFWARTDAGMSKLRTLIMGAYGHLHSPADGDSELFLKSQSVQA